MSPTDVRAYAEHWVDAWNARDAEAVLALFAEDCVFTSPTAARVVPSSGGVVRGKAALRDYWSLALAANPDLRFTLIDVYAGVDVVVLHYRNQAGIMIVEVLELRDDLVVAGHATHRQGPAADRTGGREAPA